MTGSALPLDTPGWSLPDSLTARVRHWWVERAEVEAEQLPLWLPVALGLGIALWFEVPTWQGWLALLIFFAGCALGLALLAGGDRWLRALAWGCGALALGLALAWGRAAWVSHPVLERPTVQRIVGEVETVEARPADGKLRAVLRLRPLRGVAPPVERMRLTLDEEAATAVRPGALMALRARLMPPPALPFPALTTFLARHGSPDSGPLALRLARCRCYGRDSAQALCVGRSPLTSATAWMAAREPSRPRWQQATEARSRRRMRRPCAGPASLTSFPSAGCT